MLFKEAFKPKAYQKTYAIGYYTPVGPWTTIITRIGKQSAVSSLKIPTAIFDKLQVDDNDKSIINLADFPELVIVKDEDNGFKKLEYHQKKSSGVEADVDED